MKSEDKRYIWQRNDWPHWVYDHKRLASLLAQVYVARGHLLGRMHDLGMDLRDQATLHVLTEDVLKTSEIEGEKLHPESVRSSIARRLGIDIGALAPADQHVGGPGFNQCPVNREMLMRGQSLPLSQGNHFAKELTHDVFGKRADPGSP